jgi:hypothetical protein
VSKGRSKIVARIAAEAGVPDLDDRLARLSPSDLNSLLLEILARRERTPAEILRAVTPLTAPCAIDARAMHVFDDAAFGAASDFEAVEVSPVAPLGMAHALGGIDQNNVLSALRQTEISGDPTNQLALECARRRAADPREVNLCASHRSIRMQPFDVPGFSPHFRLFALVTAGRDTGNREFETRALLAHIRFYLTLFTALNGRGFSFAAPVVEIADTQATLASLAAHGLAWDDLRPHVHAHNVGGSERLFAERNITLPPPEPLAFLDPLRAEFPDADFRTTNTRLEGLGYYSGWCLRISPLAPDGNRYPIVDGGFTDWTARLLANRKERLLATGVGSQFAATKYKSLAT